MKTYGKFVDADPGNAPAGFLAPVYFPSLGKVDVRTRDGRMILGDGFEPFELPRSIQVCTKAEGAHFGAEPAGRLDQVTVGDDGNIEGWGWMLADPVGSRAAYLTATKAMRGNSMDLSASEKDVDITIEQDDEGNLVFEIDFRESRLAATTLLTTPAFDDSYAEIPEAWHDLIPGLEAEEAEAVTAALAFAEPSKAESIFAFNAVKERPKVSAEPFQNPKLTELTPIFVDEGDRVFGHLAGWDTPHLNAEHIVPPRSESGYAYFCSKKVLTTDGFISTGALTIGLDHAAKHLLWREAIDHYANTKAAWADVVMGEDDFGIWFAGAVRPGTSNETVYAGRASALSGDWRSIGARLELVASLSVNTPGFPQPKARSFAHTPGDTLSLIGAGALPARREFAGATLLEAKPDPNIAYLAQRFATEEAREIAQSWPDDE